MSRGRLASAVLLGLILPIALPLGAQGVQPPAPPSAPSGTVTLDARDAGFATWRREAPPRTPIIHRLSSARYVAIVESARWRGDSAVAAARARALDRCGSEFSSPPDRVAELRARSSWASFDEAAGAAPLVAITIVPRVAFTPRCAQPSDAPLAADALLASGIHVASDTIVPPANDVGSVQVMDGAAERQPALSGRVPMLRIASGGYVGGDGSHAVRLYLPLDLLVPERPETELTLRVWNATRSQPETITIPTRVLRELWRDVMPWRAERLRGATAAGLPLSLPTPRDRVLARAHADYHEGRYMESALPLAERVYDPDVTRDDRLSARMQLGLTLAGHRDSAAALTIFNAALEDEPCLELPDSAPAEFRSLVNRARPEARCEGASVGEILRLGLVPGRAQRRLYPERRGAGLVPALLTGTAALGSVVLYLDARQKAADYRDARQNAAAAYAIASDARRTANIAGAATYALWAGTVVHAVWRERQLTRSKDAVRNYGADAWRPVSVGAAAQGVGLAIHVF